MGARCSQPAHAGDVLTQGEEEPVSQVDDDGLATETCRCPRIVASAKLAEPAAEETPGDTPLTAEDKKQQPDGSAASLSTDDPTVDCSSLDTAVSRSEPACGSGAVPQPSPDQDKAKDPSKLAASPMRSSSSLDKSGQRTQRPQQQQKKQPAQPQRKQDAEVEKRRRRLQRRLEADRQRKKDIEVRMVENRQVVEDILAGKYKDSSKPSGGVRLGAGESLLIRMPAPAERENTRLLVLGQFRAQYAKLGKHNSCPSAPATSQYTAQENQGLQIQGGHRSLPRPGDVKLPRNFRKPLGDFSAKQLAEFGCDNDRLLLSVYGDIFDVSDRPDKYGADGPYSWMAGNDITWGFVSGKDVPETVNKYYDLWKVAPESLRDSKIRLIYGWVAWYEFEYGDPVGKLVEYKNEAALKGPPIEEAEACCVM